MAITEQYWDTVPPLDAHYYLDNIAENDPIGSSPQARDAEAELLAAVIYPAVGRQFTRNRMAVRRDLLGQWTSDGHTPFSEDEITELRRAAFHVALSDTEVRRSLKKPDVYERVSGDVDEVTSNHRA